jgi:hypothetical protein
VESLRWSGGTGTQRITLPLAAWDQVGQLERVIREALALRERLSPASPGGSYVVWRFFTAR